MEIEGNSVTCPDTLYLHVYNKSLIHSHLLFISHYRYLSGSQHELLNEIEICFWNIYLCIQDNLSQHFNSSALYHRLFLNQVKSSP